MNQPCPISLPKKNVYTTRCPVLHALDLVGGKWKLPILWRLGEEPRQYNELKRDIVGITNMMLAQALKELEKNGLVLRKDYKEKPARVEYSLTRHGEALFPALRELYAWGELQLAENGTISGQIR